MSEPEKMYDILTLDKMALAELYNVALWHGIDIEFKGKQAIMYEILEKQQQ